MPEFPDPTTVAPMPRYKLTIEYDGAPFVGWQRQGIGFSVQQALEEAIQAFSGEAVTIGGAGRTDAGVHASGQVAHVDLARDWPEERVREAVNAHLRPHPIAILDARLAPPRFDARFSAIGRRYRYRIVNRRAPLALDQGRAWHVKAPLDLEGMAAAAERLVGHHDFTTFRSAHCQAKSPMRTLDSLTIHRDGEVVTVDTGARSFLHNQVRSMVGTLALVGQGRWTVDDVTAALEARDRTRCGPVAPAGGLCLVAVLYPPETPDPAQTPEPRNLGSDAAI